MMRGSNMGIMPYWLIILLITWGLGRIQTIATPLDRRNATTSLGGFGRTRTIATPLDRRNANASLGDLWSRLNHSHAS